MVKQAIINFCYKAVEEKMLKIYATIMSCIFLAIWIPTMVLVVKDLIKFWFNFLF
jgi:hypothetical protein